MTMTEFREQFEAHSAPLCEVGEDLLTRIFTNRLREEIRANLRLIKPKSLFELIEQANRIKERNWVLDKARSKNFRVHMGKLDYYTWVSLSPDVVRPNWWTNSTKNVKLRHNTPSQNRN